MKRLSVVAVILILPLMLAAVGCQKAEEPVKSAPKAAEKPAVKPAEKPASQVEKETLEACLKRNPDNASYCRCYASELGKRYAEKAKSGDVSVQERGQMAVQSALACKQLNKK